MTRTKEQIESDIKAGSKVCSVCKCRKIFKEYWTVARRADGVHHTCKSCCKKGTQTRTSSMIDKDIEAGSKVCTKCGERKGFKDYYDDPNVRDGKTSACKVCASKQRSLGNKLRRYSITIQEYDTMIAGGCNACGSTENLCIDHCHATGITRGVLCSSCNIALGMLEEDVERMAKLIKYTEDKCQVPGVLQ